MYLKDFIEEHKKAVYTVVICVLVVLLIAAGGLYYFIGQKNKADSNMVQKEALPEVKEIIVHVKGCVHQPGMYILPEGARVWDAIEAAGGVGINIESLDQLNLAEVLKDGQEIVVPGEYFEKAVNINTASVAELSLVPNMPKWLARDIVTYREEVGFYQSTEDILNILGVLREDYELIKGYITVEDSVEGTVSEL